MPSLTPNPDQMTHPTSVRWSRAVLCVSLMTNIALGMKVVRLNTASGLTAEESRLQLGAELMPLVARDIDGRPVTVTYADAGKPTILYVLPPSCVWCEKNEPNIRFLSDHLSDRYRIIAVSLSSKGLSAFVRKKNYSFPVYTDLDAAVVQSYKLGGTPTTIVISTANVVMKKWIGEFSGPNRTDVEKYFRVHLPR
jgi:peroxiredoxin